MPDFSQLADWYGQPHRAYHTSQHIDACLEIFDQSPLGQSLPGLEAAVVELALWFHDSYYDPGNVGSEPDNEAISADYASTLLHQAELAHPEQVIPAVCDCILATRHTAPPTTTVAAITMDVDLAILGTDRDRYQRYVQQIRAEYPWLTDADFCTGRRNFLVNQLERSCLFYTDWFRQQFEVRARRHLQQELATYALPTEGLGNR